MALWLQNYSKIHLGFVNTSTELKSDDLYLVLYKRYTMETLKEFIDIKKGIYLIDYNKMLCVVKWLSCSWYWSLLSLCRDMEALFGITWFRTWDYRDTKANRLILPLANIPFLWYLPFYTGGTTSKDTMQETAWQIFSGRVLFLCFVTKPLEWFSSFHNSPSSRAIIYP